MKKSALACMSALFMAAALVSCSHSSSSGSSYSSDDLRSALLKDGNSVDLDEYDVDSDETYLVKKVTVKGNAGGASFTVINSGAEFIGIDNISTLVIEQSVDRDEKGKNTADGTFSAENCSVQNMIVKGGGQNSIHIKGGEVKNIAVGKTDVHISLELSVVIEVIFDFTDKGYEGSISAEQGVSVRSASEKLVAVLKEAGVAAAVAEDPPEELKRIVDSHKLVEARAEAGGIHFSLKIPAAFENLGGLGYLQIFDAEADEENGMRVEAGVGSGSEENIADLLYPLVEKGKEYTFWVLFEPADQAFKFPSGVSQVWKSAAVCVGDPDHWDSYTQWIGGEYFYNEDGKDGCKSYVLLRDGCLTDYRKWLANAKSYGCNKIMMQMRWNFSVPSSRGFTVWLFATAKSWFEPVDVDTLSDPYL